MTDWILERIVLLTGVAAFLFGLAIAVVGLAIYGNGMATNLLAGFSDLLIGIAVAILVIDRLNRANARRQWISAYQALHGLLAATFVDVMRLLYVRSSAEACAANIDRYDEFIGIATLHASSLQSTIGGFAVALDPAVHTLCRKVEQRLSWMVRSLSKDAGIIQIEQDQLELMAATGQILASFIVKERDHRYIAALKAADEALAGSGFPQDKQAKLEPGELMRYRLPAQSRVLENNQQVLRALQTIANDIDNELAIYYFALDQKLLSALEPSR
jgi:hypothetical protein